MTELSAKRRPVRLIALCLLAVALSCGRGHEQTSTRVALDGNAKSLLPNDDGSQLVLFYGSELLGSLDGCGCMGNPRLGGLPYRFAYTEGFRSAFPDVGVLQLDAGFAMASITNTEGQVVPDFVTANEWVLRAVERLGFDAVNLTEHDAPFIAWHLAHAREGGGASTDEVLDRFVSANLEPTRAGLVAPKPYLIRTVTASRVAGASMRVAIAGVTQENHRLEALCGYRTTNAAAALARVLPRARSESDLVVVLAYLPPAQADTLVERLTGLADVVIVANSLSGDRSPVLDAPVRATYSWYKTQKLGVLRLRFDNGRIASASNDYVKLDEPLPRDPLAQELASSAEAAVRETRERRFSEEVGGSDGDAADPPR